MFYAQRLRFLARTATAANMDMDYALRRADRYVPRRAPSRQDIHGDNIAHRRFDPALDILLSYQIRLVGHQASSCMFVTPQRGCNLYVNSVIIIG
ncbi:hypothetical protein BF95_03585 [Sphingobium sp. Ant17]|nr:hypothetical protein BF95_03585 [Sphingobium sp. Ant17]